MRIHFKLTKNITKKINYLCLGTLLAQSAWGQTPTPTPTLSPDEIRAAREQHLDFKPEDFAPHMVDHLHQGCPVNSSCTKELGKSRELFVSTLKAGGALDKVIKKSGAPIPIFVATKQNDPNANYNDPNFIIWDSPCENHHMIGESVYLAEAIVKNLDELNSLPKARAGLILVESPKGEITSFNTPRDHAPRYIQNNRLVFLFEEVGNYYSLSLDKNGSIASEKLNSELPSPEHSECSKSLTDFYNQIPNERKIAFGHHFCRSLYNSKTKKRELALLAWSCK